MSREAPFQDRLKGLLESVASKYRFDGLEIARVERNYPIGKSRKEADIITFLRGEVPFLIIETKRKVEKETTWRPRSLFKPLDLPVVGQVASYVAIYKDQYATLTPFFATANPVSIAVFRTPKNIEDFVELDKAYGGEYEHALKPGAYARLVKDYLVVSEESELTEEYVHGLLDRLARDYRGAERLKVEPTWALIGYFRSFVNELSDACKDLLKLKMQHDSALKAELNKLGEESGSIPDAASLAKMMAYVLLNKIIFYKVLEEKYKLRKMGALDTSSSTRFVEQLNRYFDEAIEATGDFEPIFKTGIYDMLVIPDDPMVMESVNEFILTLDNIRVVEIADLVGYIYEELIPPEERHRLGQFYTPPAICELIAKWAIRSQDDLILDPGVGSGGFLLWAYRALLKLKTGRDTLPASKEVHERILKQLYAMDINPFPAHLTAVNLAMRNVRAPSTETNVILDDFFNAEPGKLYPVRIKTAKGELTRTIVIPPELDVIIGNPPYTRWTEIPERTQNRILELHREEIKRYGLTPQVRRGVEPGIYVYWIIHATKFLKEGGRLGMIISDSWLQADYGLSFASYLLDNYKIKAVLDFSSRLFRIPLIGTLVLLLEKCSEEAERNENEVVFAYVNKEASVEELLKVVEDPKAVSAFPRVVVKQRELPRDRKWIGILFGAEEIIRMIKNLRNVVKLGELFEACYGNITYLYLTSRGNVRGVRNIGGESFFYLTEEKAKEQGLFPEYTYPLLSSSKYMKYFTFNQEDWESIKKQGKEAYVFIAHKPLEELPEAVRKYISLGETEIKIQKGKQEGKPVCETEASRARREHPEHFYGWYDLGGVIKAPIYVTYGSRYWMRFVLSRFHAALDHRILSLIPKEGISFNKEELKALLAFLNSSFSQLQAELKGRVAGGVALLEFDVKSLSELLTIDIRSLPREQIKRLANLFDELEGEARKVGGADDAENVLGSDLVRRMLNQQPKAENPGLFNTAIRRIDEEVGKILGLSEFVEPLRNTVLSLMERRLARASEAKPESIKGKEEPKIKPPKKVKVEKREENKSLPLERFFAQ